MIVEFLWIIACFKTNWTNVITKAIELCNLYNLMDHTSSLNSLFVALCFQSCFKLKYAENDRILQILVEKIF